MKTKYLISTCLVTFAGLTACKSKPTPVEPITVVEPPSIVDNAEMPAAVAVPSTNIESLTTSPLDIPVTEVVPATHREFLVAAKKAERAGDVVKRLEYLAKAVDMKPKHGRTNIEMARVLISQGDFTKAESFAVKATELNEKSSYGWNTLGRVFMGKKQLEEAAEAFEQATTINEDNSYAWNNLGLVLLEMGETDEAALALEKATSGQNPTSYMWNNLGMAYELLGQFEDARAAYRQGESLGSTKAKANLERILHVEDQEPYEEEGC